MSVQYIRDIQYIGGAQYIRRVFSTLGVCSTLGVLSTLGEYHEYIRGVHCTSEGAMSTSGDVQCIGGIP